MLTANQAHDSDVNVISWSNNEPFILSGGDDGVLKIWDLRQFDVGILVLYNFIIPHLIINEARTLHLQLDFSKYIPFRLFDVGNIISSQKSR